jgi:hypothetical protein
MSKLNKAPKKVTKTVAVVAAKHNLTVAHSANGNLQFKKEPLQHLYELTVSTLFGRSTFYRSSDALVQSLRTEVRTAVEMGALDFVANLAIHARGEMNIRTIPIVLVVEFAKALREQGKTYPHLRHLVRDVIQRADQITDMYAYSLDVFGEKGKIPMAIKRGVGDAFNNFGEYAFAKYNRAGAITIKDVLRIVHPVANEAKQGAIFQKIIDENLETPYTWETELSRNGQLPEAERKSKAKLWTELLTSEKLGYMALLRNMRNIHDAGVAHNVVKTHVADIIADEQRVAASRQLTFDFLQAYDVIKPLNSSMATAVSKAVDISVKYLPKVGEKIWVIIDYSGSMSGKAIETATLLAAALLKANDGSERLAVTMFGSAAKTIHTVDTNNSVLAIQRELLTHRRGNIAGSTEFQAAMREYPGLGFVPDTIVVFTDGEINRFHYPDLQKNSGDSNTVKLVVNLDGAPTTPFIKQAGWYAMAGWTPAMFKWVPAIRNKETVVDALSGPYTERKSK